MAKLNLKTLAENLKNTWNQGVQNVKNTPWQTFTPMSMKSTIVPDTMAVGEGVRRLSNNIFKTNITPQQAGNVSNLAGYGIRGMASVTPFQAIGKINPLQKVQAQTNTVTPQQRTAEKIGRGIGLTAMTSPLGGGALRMAGNSLIGTGLGTGIGAGMDLISGRKITKQSLMENAAGGFEFSGIAPLSNAITEMALSKIAPQLTSKLVTQPFATGQVKEGLKRLFQQALADSPIQNTAMTILGRMDQNSQNSFMKDWLGNLPSTLLMNVGTAGIRGTWNTAINKESRQAIGDALQKTIRHWTLPITTTEIDPRTGLRVTMPMWQYKMQNAKAGLGVQDLSKLTPEEYKKVTGKEAPKSAEGKLYDVPQNQKALLEEATKRGYKDKNPLANIWDVKEELQQEQGQFQKVASGLLKKYEGLVSEGKIKPTKNQGLLDIMSASDKKLYSDALKISDNASAILKTEFAKPNVPQAGLYDATVKKFGLTTNPQESLYITPEGKFLKTGSGDDIMHDEFVDTLTKNKITQQDFSRQTGMLEIRYDPRELDIRAYSKPTPQQLNELANLSQKSRNVFIEDFSSGKVKSYSSERNNLRDFFNVAQQPLKDVSNSKGNYTGQVKGLSRISKQELKKQSISGLSTRTKATSELLSQPIIPPKGKLNIKRLNVEGEAKNVLQTQEAGVVPTVIGNKEVVDMARTAKGTGTMSDETMKKLMAQQLKNRQQVVDLTQKYNKAKASGASDVELAKIMLEIADQSQTARQGGTFAGRLLQAQNILADQSASPMQKIFALLDNAEVPKEKYIKEAVNVNWEKPSEVVNFYRKFVPPKFGEVLDEIRYSNMLSSPLTHIINTASNALQTGVVAPIEKTITGTLDFGKSLLTGSERKYYTRAGIDYAGGYLKSLPQAFKKAASVLSGEEVLIKPDYERIPTGTKGALKAYTLPLRALEAMDQFFKTLVEGGVSSELKKSPLKLSEVEIASRATKEANYRLFRQAFDPNGELGQGIVLKSFDKWNSAMANLRRLPGGKWILPFLQTPTNILKQGIEYSPLGITTAFGAKNATEQVSKALMGSAVFLGAYQLAKNGLTTWSAPPSNSTESDLYYAAGIQPYSVKIGNKWVSYSKLGPLSYPIAMAAALASAEKTKPDQSKVKNIGSAVSGMLQFFGDQSYVRSIGDLVDAIQGGINVGPTALSSEGANLLGQLIPYKSFLTWLGRMMDPRYTKAKTFGQKLIKDIPVVGKTLPAYTDLNGKPSVRDYPVLNSVSPYKITQEKANEAKMYNDYSLKKIDKGIEKRADEAFMAGDTSKEVSGNIIRYIDEEGNLKKLDLTPIEKPTLTGQTELDKIKISSYNSDVNAQIKAYAKLEELGKISSQEAEAAINKLMGTKIVKAKSAKKPKKITFKAYKYKAPKITVKKKSTLKLPSLKVAKPKKIKIVRRYTIK